jgi:hypothetical protein
MFLGYRERKKIFADLIQINARISRRSPSRISPVGFKQQVRKRADTTTSFCSDADNLGATFDRT